MRSNSGFTLIEIIVVVSIIAVVYFVAIPQFNLVTGTEVAEKLGRLSSDIRSAYDMAVLHGRPHRLVFELRTGKYWLEQADREAIYLADEKVAREPSADEIAEQQEIFEAKFKRYEDIVGKAEIKDPETDEIIKLESPVINAKARLQPAKWTKIENLEWGDRTIGPYLGFKSIQSEHHAEKQTLDLLGPEGRVALYFFPQGYVEQCIMQMGYTNGDQFEDNKKGYTLFTKSYEGTAEVVTETDEIEIEDRENDF